MQIHLAQIIFQAINFGVVLGALVFLLFKPVIKMLDQRAKKIADAQKAAEETLLEKEKLDAYKKKVKTATDNKAKEAVAEVQQKAKETEKKLMAEAKEKAAQEVEKQKAEFEAHKKKELAKMKKEFEKAVAEAAKKVLGASIDTKKHQKIIDQELETLLKKI
jgi:F-type H+-transporting ATPase subunit b